jgi:hypothetical protein
MPAYSVPGNFTDQRIRTVRDSLKVAQTARAMNRRGFVVGLGAVLASSVVAEAQQVVTRTRLIGILGLVTPAPGARNTFISRLADLGYVEAGRFRSKHGTPMAGPSASRLSRASSSASRSMSS